MAFLFDEVNDYILCDTSGGYLDLPDGDWTLAGWVKLTDNTGSQFQYICSQGTAGANPSFNWFIVEASHATSGDRNELRFNIGDDDTTVITADSTGQPFLSNTSWTHILIQRSGSTVTQYINGSADGAVTNASFDAMGSVNSFYFGRRSDGDADRFFGGSMAEWALWYRALNTAEITALKNGYSPLCFRLNLTRYIPMVREYVDIKTGGAFTVNNFGTTVTAHPRIIRPTRPHSALHPQTIATQDIILSGIASSGALGTSSLELNITGSGLASGSAIGTASLQTDDTINCSGLASTSAFGTSVITRAETIDMSGLPSTSVFGTSVVANTQILTLTGISSTEAFGTSVLSNVVTLEPSGISSTEQFGETTLSNTQIITLEGIPSTSIFGTTLLVDLGFSLITPTTGDFEQQLW